MRFRSFLRGSHTLPLLLCRFLDGLCGVLLALAFHRTSRQGNSLGIWRVRLVLPGRFVRFWLFVHRLACTTGSCCRQYLWNNDSRFLDGRILPASMPCERCWLE